VTQPVTFVIKGLQDLHFGAFQPCGCSGAGCHERSVRMTEFGGKAGGGWRWSEPKVCYHIEKIGHAKSQVGTKVTGRFGLGSANIKPD
jgi:hypothetical protein